MRTKSTTKDILHKITIALGNDSLNVNEIASKADLQWITVKENLQILKQLGIVAEMEGLFKLVGKRNLTVSKDTFFGIPITEKQRDEAKILFSRIRTLWEKETAEKPSNTHVQKIAVKIIEKFSLDIPYGWYLYGPTTLLAYSSEKEYSKTPKKSNWDTEITRYIKEFKDLKVWQLMNQFYKDNPLYSKKVSLKLALRFNPDKPEMNNKLYSFVFTALTEKEYPEYITTYAKDFLSITPLILQNTKKFSEEEKEELLLELDETFDVLWNIIALENLKTGLCKSRFKYSEEEINLYLENDFKTLVYDYENKISYWYQLIKKDILQKGKCPLQGKYSSKKE